MPKVPEVLAPRRKSRQIKVGKVLVGGDAQVSVQSMTTTPTPNINATLQQIAELTASGCDIVRVAVPSRDDAEALPIIAKKSQIPVIADIHFQPNYVFAGDRRRLRRGAREPGQHPQVRRPGRRDRAPRRRRPASSIRIGVNAGSLDPRLLQKYGKATPEALVESAVWEASLFEEHDFHDFKISVKHNDPIVMVKAYRLLAERGDWPLHLGVTEAGPAFQGTIKRATAFGILLSEGIGDTIRVSLSAPPVEEVKVGLQILQSLNLRERKLEIVSCPSCGRAQVDVYKLANDVTDGLEGMTVPLRVAVMGCVVNGPGEAREADLGVASGNGKGQIFVKGEVIKTVPESEIVATLIEEANRLAAEMGADAPVGTPEVAHPVVAQRRPSVSWAAEGCPRGIRSREETAMSGDGSEFEYPDTAGYPDGMGTLHEGIDDAADATHRRRRDGGGGRPRGVRPRRRGRRRGRLTAAARRSPGRVRRVLLRRPGTRSCPWRCRPRAARPRARCPRERRRAPGTSP